METNEEVNVGFLSTLKPTVNFANKMATERGQSWGPRTISDCQLIFVVSGKAILTLGEKNNFIKCRGMCILRSQQST